MDGINKRPASPNGKNRKSPEVDSPKRVKTHMGPLSPVKVGKMLPTSDSARDHKKLADHDVQSTITENSDSGISTLASSSASILDDTFPLAPEEQLEHLLAETQKFLGDSFDSRLFLSGRGQAQLEQIERMADWLLDNINSIAAMNSDAEPGILVKLLSALKTTESSQARRKELSPYSFAMRSIILLASEKSGAGIESWDAYTQPSPGEKALKPSDPEFWPWIEKHTSWVPEAQAAFLKYVETAFVAARKLSSRHQEDQIVAYKGGYGAGKTSHGKETFGHDEDAQPLFSGSVAPDSAKHIMRKAMPLSHGTVHLQGSNIAFNLFDGLIDRQGMGTIVYDTSLSRATDIENMIKKAVKAGKPLKVVDIARDDKARMLAVLGRKVDGEDPRTPASFLLAGAKRDRAGRAECLNTVLKSQKSQHVDKKTKETKELVHSYELYCGDPAGSDRQWLVTLKSSEPPQWNPDLSKEEIDRRLASQGIKFNTDSGLFEQLNPSEDWSAVMHKELHKPARELVSNLSQGEAEVRRKQLTGRTIQFVRPLASKSAEDAYYSLALPLTLTLPKKAFLDAFSVLDPEAAQQLINDMYDASKAEQPISYLDLPTLFALEFNRYLTATPSIWSEDNE